MMNTKTDTTSSKKRQGSTMVLPPPPVEEQTQLQPKRRGSPKGVLKGPRKVFFVGFAVDQNGELIKHELMFDKPEEATEENASEMFEKQCGLVPLLAGPYHKVVRAHSGGIQRRQQGISIPLAELKFSNKRVEGEYNGWKVIGHGIEGHPDIIHPLFGDQIDPKAKKRQPPRFDLISLSSLQNCRTI